SQGLVLIRANSVTGTGRFTANGSPGPTTSGDDGAGGGGAGGAVILRATGQVGCGAIQAQGGAGGNVSEPSFALGPGGGGGGGQVLLQSRPLSGCAINASGGPAGVNVADGGERGPTFGATPGKAGVIQQFDLSYRTPPTPALTSPEAGELAVSNRPRFEGTAEPGLVVSVYVDDVVVVQAVAGTDGVFSVSWPASRPALSQGAHRVSLVADDALGAYSPRSAERTFHVGVVLADGGVVEQPILVVPAAGDIVGPTPLFAGVSNAVTVGIEIDDRPEVTLSVDAFGRFRYQVPADDPLPPGPHFVTVHAHNETGGTGPYSPRIVFESVDADAGTPVQDAGTETPDAGVDAGTSAPDAGTSTPDAGTREVPVLVVPADGEVVDSTPLFAGVAGPGDSVSIEVDGKEVARVTADSTGAFRHPVPADQALATGAHKVTAYALVSATGAAGPRSPETGFEVRGPTNLDVGCGGCGASPAGVVGGWALLAGLAAAVRRRRR
ncbi:hypothetical protein HPC49_18900, partial [Pyxidicoccus fallax]|uniref:MYXO-CTERM sorting domain-containing protein n=1 Tax=Pyxidicoccus fallax TaxID=394095 RepID=UPI0020A6323D